jgi:hypothetical protein
MRWSWREGGGWVRLLRAIALGVLAALILLGLSLVPNLVFMLPWWVRWFPIEWTAAALLTGYSVAWALRNRRHERTLWTDRLAWVLDRVEAVCRTLLERWLVVGFMGLSILWLLMWLPHYPNWPLCRDADNYAQMAQEWDSGVLPYRDIRSFNFPGHMYLHWILGKLFGWGHTGLFYTFDATALLCLGAVIIAWSRRRLGQSLPGTAAYLIFLAYYLDASFGNVAQRDWHSPLCAILGLLGLEAWPGRRSRWLSALLAAMAFTIRPQVVLFLPAFLVAAMSGDDRARGTSPAEDAWITFMRTILPALEWICAFAIFVAVAFAPLLLSGLLDALVRGLDIVRRGGPYADATIARSLRILWEELRQAKISALGIGLLLLSLSRDRDLKMMARTWLLALLGVLIYRPIHPVDHGYLKTPLALVGAVAWAIPIAWIVRATSAERRIRSTLLPGVLAVLLIVYESIPMQFPGNCSLRTSVDSILAAPTGGRPVLPPGELTWYRRNRSYYSWDGYCRLLKYVRENTGPRTIVANVLKHPPFPSVNGAIGRRSPFRVESGVAWMWVVAEDLDESFSRELEQLGCDSIVVWSPEEIDQQPRLQLKRLTSVIMERYEPEARFGKIEVWRRKCSPLAGAGDPRT